MSESHQIRPISSTSSGTPPVPSAESRIARLLRELEETVDAVSDEIESFCKSKGIALKN